MPYKHKVGGSNPSPTTRLLCEVRLQFWPRFPLMIPSAACRVAATTAIVSPSDSSDTSGGTSLRPPFGTRGPDRSADTRPLPDPSSLQRENYCTRRTRGAHTFFKPRPYNWACKRRGPPFFFSLVLLALDKAVAAPKAPRHFLLVGPVNLSFTGPLHFSTLQLGKNRRHNSLPRDIPHRS